MRDLGLWLDEGMNMQTQIQSFCKAANYSLYKIGRVRKFLNQSCTERLVHAFISSRLDFNNALLYGLPEKSLLPLQRIQNRAARLVCRKRKRDHITPVLRELHWLPIKLRIVFKVLLYCFKMLRRLAPEYLYLPHAVTTRHTRSSASDVKLLVRHTRTSYGDRAFSSCAPKLWNNLPIYIQAAPTISNFKRLLKTWLFTRHFEGVAP